MKKPVQININLLPKDPFYSTVIGKVLRWALSAGRYIVIFTELVVIFSFVARFTLDRQVTDLNQSIAQKKVIIESYGNLEEEVRAVQDKILQYRQFEQETSSVETFANLTEVMPTNINLKELTINPTYVVISGETNSQQAFNLLINNLQISDKFHNIDVNSVESDDKNIGMLSFRIKADTRLVQTVNNTRNNNNGNNSNGR